MKHYSFSAFLVDEENREAFEICQDVVNLRPVRGTPITLVGPAGCGKTHLLYAIVNRVRANNRMRPVRERIDQAYLKAHDFPDPVRGLIDDSVPVERSKGAILLVDQLEQFDTLVEELEVVVRIFLSHNHYVVLASRTRPEHLTNITEGLRQILVAGRIVPTGRQTPVRGMNGAADREQAAEDDFVRGQQAEVQRLRLQLERAERDGSRSHEAESQGLRDALEAERTANEELREKLGVAKTYCESVQNELDATRKQLVQFEGEAESTAGTLRQVQAELASVSEAERELRRLLSQPETQTTLENEVKELRRKLERAETESNQARTEANGLLHRAETLLTQVETNRREYAQVEENQRGQLRELESLIGGRTSTAAIEELAEANGAAAAAQEELASLQRHVAQTRENLEAELSLAKADARHAFQERDHALAAQQQFQTERNNVTAERDRLQEDLDMTVEERDTFRTELAELKEELDKTLAERENLEADLAQAEAERENLRGDLVCVDAERKRVEAEADRLQERLRRQNQEMEALRQEAAGQVAAANTQAGEAQRSLGELRARLDDIRRINQTVAMELAGFRDGLAEGVGILDELATRVSATTLVSSDECREPERAGQLDFLLYPDEEAQAPDGYSDAIPMDSAVSEGKEKEENLLGDDLARTIEQLVSEARMAGGRSGALAPQGQSSNASLRNRNPDSGNSPNRAPVLEELVPLEDEDASSHRSPFRTD